MRIIQKIKDKFNSSRACRDYMVYCDNIVNLAFGFVVATSVFIVVNLAFFFGAEPSIWLFGGLTHFITNLLWIPFYFFYVAMLFGYFSEVLGNRMSRLQDEEFHQHYEEIEARRRAEETSNSLWRDTPDDLFNI